MNELLSPPTPKISTEAYIRSRLAEIRRVERMLPIQQSNAPDPLAFNRAKQGQE